MGQLFSGVTALLPEYELREISESEYGDVFALYRTNPEYFALEQNHPITLQETITGIRALPPRTDRSHKHFVGFYRNGMLDAVLDFIDGYPAPDMGWIGLFIVDQRLQRQGIGQRLVAALCASMLRSGLHAVQLAVIEGNTTSLTFWKNLGFKEIRRQRTRWDLIILEFSFQ